MTDRELMQQALDALENVWVFVNSREKIKQPEGGDWYREVVKTLRARLAQPEPEPVALSGLPMVIAGALFDFAGYLTTRHNVIRVGSSANASPMVELLKEWAAMRGLSLDEAAVLSWQETIKPDYTAPPQREWVGLTDEEIEDACWTEVDQRLRSFARAVEQKLKEKNGV